MLYANRTVAGDILARALTGYRGGGALVLGIPRGGVVVAARVAAALGAELDVAIARKIPSPWQPELAIGAVAPDGHVFVNQAMVRAVVAEFGYPDLPTGYLEAAAARARAEIDARRERYAPGRPWPAVAGRVVLLVDDGIATGFTALVTLQWLRRQQPAVLVLAVPVAPPDSLEALAPHCDRIVCPHRPADFAAVGQYYRQFEQTDDGEVTRLLARSQAMLQ